MLLLVLTEEHVWDDFRPAVEAIGDTWTAPSGRVYRLGFHGHRLEVYLQHDDLGSPPPGALVDADLLALASKVYDDVGEEWSSDALTQTAAAWGWPQ